MINTQTFSELLDLGFSVFPLPYGTKKPFQSWKQFQHSKPSVTQCQEWEKTQQNVAIVTGEISHIFVVDIDGEEGKHTIENLEWINGKLPDTVVSTIGRGRHIYLQYPQEQIIHNLAGQSAHGEVLAGVDIRGNGGYVVAPPSKHPNGNFYQWTTSPSDTPIAHAPDWLLDMVVKPEYLSPVNISTNHCFEDKIQQQCQNIEKATMGNRNNALNQAAFHLGQYMHLGIDEVYARQRLTKSALLIGLDKPEIEATIKSGLSAGKAKPRSVGQWDNPDMSIIQRTEIPLPECPHHLLSNNLRQFVDDAAACKCAPPDYILAALLNAASGLIGNARRVKIWEGWTEPTALWFMLVGLPSCNKSPALDAIFPELEHIEAEYRSRYLVELRDYKQAQEQRKAMKGFGLTDQGTQQDDDTVIAEKPIQKRIIVNDATVEKIALILADNPKGLIYSRDELAGLLANLEKHGGNDRPFYLESSGGRPMTIDRVKYGDAIYVPSVLLSIIGSIQPDKLDQLLIKQPDDGLAARFLYVYGTPRKVIEPNTTPNTHLIRSAFSVLEALDVTLDDNGIPTHQTIPLCITGRKLIEQLANRLQMQEHNEYGMLVSHLGKLRGIAGRLALVLCYLEWSLGFDDEPKQIDATYVEKSVHMVEQYFYPMAKRCLQNTAIPQDESDARLVAQWILNNNAHTINARQVLRDVIPQRGTKRRDAALHYLEETGWIQQIETYSKATNYRVNSRVFDT